MRILGISAFYHDSAAALVENGRIVAAAQEERFTRKRHDVNYPARSIAFVLEAGRCRAADLDHVVFYDKPFLKFERLLETYMAFSPRGRKSFFKAMPLWLREKLFQKRLLINELKALDETAAWADRLLFAEHHQSHAASAFYPSPFEKANILTMDGVGEWATTSLATGSGNRITMQKEIHFPHSLGLLYSAFTYHAGFKVNSGEYKLMGLAPYGEPRYRQLILDNLIDIKRDGSFRLNMKYFDYCTGLTMTNAHFDELFGAKPRSPESALTQREMDLAASVQAVLEEAVLRLAKAAVQESGIRNLCLAGGVALNCVANGRLLREGVVDDLWVQPAAGDAGGAIGAALAAAHMQFGLPRRVGEGDAMAGGLLGPAYSNGQIVEDLQAMDADFEIVDDDQLIETAAAALETGKVVGWFQGRMEFGPRALGARSILADPRLPSMQKTLNLKIKFRESFRPFAPAVLREDVDDYFDFDKDSPYMLIVAPVKENRRLAVNENEKTLFGIDRLKVARSEIPAVTHVDFSSRIQTVDKETNPRFHALLTAFKSKTGCSVLVNTSFNVRGEPIVSSPEDAYRCFLSTDMDILAIGNCILRKEAQRHRMTPDMHLSNYELD
ncbi:MAG: carbamoyltransferase [Bdellovibrionales bacterium]